MTTAKEIKDLLALKHSSDLFIPECKTGSSAKGCLRMDAWVMRKSWANYATIGYEIKVSRADFIGDKKWPMYLKYCNEFYFVCPPKIIMPEEVGEDAGLLWCSESGNRLYTKKKAPYRSKITPEDVFIYILMWRTKVVEEYQAESGSIEWTNWLAQKDEDKHLGYNVSSKIRKLVEQRIDLVDRENQRLKNELDKLKDVAKFVKDLGVDIHGWCCEDRIKTQIDNIKRSLPKNFIDNVTRLKNECDGLLKSVEKVN